MPLVFRHTTPEHLEERHLRPAPDQGPSVTHELWAPERGRWQGEAGWGANALVVGEEVKVVWLYYRATDRRALLHGEYPTAVRIDVLLNLAQTLLEMGERAHAEHLAECVQALR